jgi:hypothetical protein
MPEKTEQDIRDDEEFINSLLGTDDEEDEKAEEAIRIKNKNAEEARKRREAEAKTQAEQQQVEDAKVEETPKVEEAKKEPVEEVKEQPKKQDVNRLGEQLVEFKKKYPEIDLQELDNDRTFKRYIDGKLLGSRDFTALYEEFIEFKADLSGVETQAIQRNYIKAQSSSGSSTSTSTTTGDIFSEEEMKQLSGRLPLMNPKDLSKVEEKLKRSIAYYDKK